MATTRIKEKISQIVASQLPEFVQTDYTTFVSFIEAYYKFLEQDQGALELVQNARSYNDIDQTTESFVQYFLKTYVNDLPLSTLANNRLLIKKIKDLYESKGSEISFNLLFNLLFQKDVEIKYPFENVLRASAGRWDQKVAINVTTVTGDRDVILNRSLLYTSNGQDYSTPIVLTKNYSDTITQVFLDQTKIAPSYTIGDTVEVRNANSVVFSGTISGTPIDYSVLRAGTGFRTGQIYNINASGGLGSLVRISNVSNTGAITEVKFISYGSGYTSNVFNVFNVDLDSTKRVAGSSEISDVIFDATQGFGSYGSIVKYDPADPERYFDEDYVDLNPIYAYTTTLATFNNSVTSPSETTFGKPPGTATIQFLLGGLARFPGTYITNEGFISELDIRLEDGLSYQPFAYQTNTDLDISDFFDIVTQLVHPAGQVLFNNRILTSTIDFNSNVLVDSASNIFEEALSVFDALDLYTANIGKNESELIPVLESNVYTLTKPLEDNVIANVFNTLNIQPVYEDNVVSTESLILDIDLGFDELANVVEQATLTVTKPNITGNESNVVVFEAAYGLLQDYFAQSYIGDDYVGIQFDLFTFSGTVFADTLTPSEQSLIQYSTTFNELSNVIEESTLTLNNQINNIINLSESGFVVNQDYFASSFIGEDYVGTSSNLI